MGVFIPNIYYYAEPSSECDFVIYPEGRVALPVQVSWTLTDLDTRKREIKGLLKAAAYCKAEKGWILTLDEEEELTIDGVDIQIMLAWKWMLQTHQH